MIRIVRGKYILIVSEGSAYMIRAQDNALILSVSDPEAIEALIDCFSEDIPEPV